MGKNGNRPRAGRPSLPPSKEVEQAEHLRLPPPPLHVRPAKPVKPALASRSLLAVAFRHIKPDWRRYIEYVDLAARKGDAAMARFRDCYQALDPLDRRRAWPEQICNLANVSPGELVGAVCRQIWESEASESSMISSIAHPELLLDTIRFAKKEENYHDRELFFRMMGSLPDRKGASINIFNAAAGNTEVKLPDLGRGKLRTFDEEIIEMSRDLETEDKPPFLMKQDVPPTDH